MARYALVDADGVITNVILLDEGADFTPPDGLTLVADDGTAQPGGGYDGQHFTAPPPQPNPDAGDDPIAKLKAFLDSNPDVAALLG